MRSGEVVAAGTTRSQPLGKGGGTRSRLTGRDSIGSPGPRLRAGCGAGHVERLACHATASRVDVADSSRVRARARRDVRLGDLATSSSEASLDASQRSTAEPRAARLLPALRAIHSWLRRRPSRRVAATCRAGRARRRSAASLARATTGDRSLEARDGRRLPLRRLRPAAASTAAT